jgi:hypothetical protein
MESNVYSLGSLDDDILQGFWINRSFSKARGATLTLDPSRGGLLIAFLALFVATTGNGFWKIIRCILHITLSSDDSRDVIYLQRQAILRNSRLAADAALDLTKTSYIWHKKAHAAKRRLLPSAFLALLTALSFIAAGTKPLQPCRTCRY